MSSICKFRVENYENQKILENYIFGPDYNLNNLNIYNLGGDDSVIEILISGEKSDNNLGYFYLEPSGLVYNSENSKIVTGNLATTIDIPGLSTAFMIPPGIIKTAGIKL